MADINSLEELGAAIGSQAAVVETPVADIPTTEADAPVSDGPVYVQKIDEQGRAYATGKRKDAIARVWIKPGAGKVIINGREYEKYFARPVLQMVMRQPILAANRDGQYDIIATVKGGGLSGQAGAVRVLHRSCPGVSCSRPCA